jgi:hypothetical protein
MSFSDLIKSVFSSQNELSTRPEERVSPGLQTMEGARRVPLAYREVP